MKRGERQHQLKGRALPGRADQDVQAPGDRYEIDATIADCYLVSVFDELRIVGRPVIYCVIDTWSRMVVGVYVGFEGPSWIGAMMALINVVTPKIDFCRTYGIDIGPDEWPCHLAPAEIMADRGELLSVALGHNIIKKLGIDIANVAAYRGDLKGIVERTHRTLPTIWRPFVPGYVEPDFGERGGTDYRLKGALTLEEFTRQVILSILVYNAEPPKGNRKATPEMVSAGLTSAPLDFWNWGVENLGPRLHELTVDQVALEVMPRGSATVTPRGIRFKGAHYDCDLAHRQQWYEGARSGRTWKVDVSYDPRDLGTLYMRTEETKEGYDKLRLVDVDRDRSGKSLFEVEELDLTRKKVEASGADDRTTARILREEQMRSIAVSGKERLAAALRERPLSPAQRTKNIRANRAEEKKHRREDETLSIGLPDARTFPGTLVGRPPPGDVRSSAKDARRKRLAQISDEDEDV